MQQASIDPISKTSFLPFKGRIKVGMGIKKPLCKPILTPALSLKAGLYSHLTPGVV
jgi:hypothetical protein